MRARTAAGNEGLNRILTEPAGALLVLDLDGTLAEIAEDPGQVRPYPGALSALARLAAAVRAVAVLTGRSVASARHVGGFGDGAAGVPGLVLLGHYGRERWSAEGGLRTAGIPDGVARARRELAGVLDAAGAPQGTWTEDKGGSLAVHTRRTAAPEAALASLRAPLGTLAEQHGLLLQPGRDVLELRPAGVDKGTALRELAAEYRATSVLFAGDDLADIAAFDAVSDLRAEGIGGVRVLSASTEVGELGDRADIVVGGPAGVVGLLGELADALEPARRP